MLSNVKTAFRHTPTLNNRVWCHSIYTRFKKLIKEHFCWVIFELCPFRANVYLAIDMTLHELLTVQAHGTYALVYWNPHPPDPWHIGGFDKGPDQIIPKPPVTGENLEIKFPSPWEQIGKGLKTTNKQTNQKKTVHTELIRNNIYFNKAIVTKSPCCGLLHQLQEYKNHIATEHFSRVIALKMFNSTFSAKPLSTCRVRRKWKDEVALRASCCSRLLARRSEELARN